MRIFVGHICDFLDFIIFVLWGNCETLTLLTFLGPAATYRTGFFSCFFLFGICSTFWISKVFFMEQLQTTHLFDVFGTSDLTQIDFLWPRGPRGAERDPMGADRDPRGGQGVPRVPFRHPYGRLAHPIGEIGAL